MTQDEELELLLRGLPDDKLGEIIESLPENLRDSLVGVAQEYKSALDREMGQKDFMQYVKLMWPNFIHGRHHEKMARAFERVANG